MCDAAITDARNGCGSSLGSDRPTIHFRAVCTHTHTVRWRLQESASSIVAFQRTAFAAGTIHTAKRAWEGLHRSDRVFLTKCEWNLTNAAEAFAASPSARGPTHRFSRSMRQHQVCNSGPSSMHGPRSQTSRYYRCAGGGSGQAHAATAGATQRVGRRALRRPAVAGGGQL